MKLACRLRELREAREISLRDAEVETGISRARLSLLERGIMFADDEWVPALEAFYGAPAETWSMPSPGVVAGVAIERDG